MEQKGEPMDLIERQAAIDAISYSIELCNKALDSMTLGGRDRYAVEVERNSLLKLKDDFKLLPFAQPEKRTEERTETHACDLISRQEALDAIDKRVQFLKDDPVFRRKHGDIDLYGIKPIIRALPSAQPERKTGEWILSDAQNSEDVRNGNYAYICSNCLHSDIHAKTAVVPFCWHCGADMREEN